ncbi:MAG: hypothetical protein H6907_11705 [Hyphomicrobiales bacterium]|nr:hypothetical protein [Hyphomicrobiales bacterium]MCP5372387.1 hypothetical protein [Hyphomicrobiales bacterium]
MTAPAALGTMPGPTPGETPATMADRDKEKPTSAPPPRRDDRAARQQRLSEALRENLRKRKQQARARDGEAPARGD